MSERDDGDYGTGDFASTVRVSAEPVGGDQPDTAEIRDDIERTRAEMGQTIDAIQERLTGDSSGPIGGPGELAKEVAAHVVTEVRGEVTSAIHDATQQAKSAARAATIGRAEAAVNSANETMKGTGTTMMDRIKQNPVPAAIAAAGIGWLALGGSGQKSDQQVTYRSGYGPSGTQGGSQGSYGHEDDGQGIAAQAMQTAGNLVGQTGEKASNLAGGVQETAGQVAGATQEKAQSMGGGIQRFLQESPLAAGLIAAGLGMAAGMAIPSTPKEDQLMGSARDSVVAQAQDKVGETVDKVQQVAAEATQVVKEQAQEQGLVG